VMESTDCRATLLAASLNIADRSHAGSILRKYSLIQQQQQQQLLFLPLLSFLGWVSGGLQAATDAHNDQIASPRDTTRHEPANTHNTRNTPISKNI
jgi:hypothetical protein